MSDFATGYFIIFGGLVLFGAIAAIYFYFQDRKEEPALEAGPTVVVSEENVVFSSESIKAVKGHTRRAPSSNGDWLKAADYFEKSSGLAETIGDWQGRALALRNLGKLCAKQGRITEAKNSFDKALSIYEDMDDKLSMARVFNELGLLFSHGFESETKPAAEIES